MGAGDRNKKERGGFPWLFMHKGVVMLAGMVAFGYNSLCGVGDVSRKWMS